MKEQTVCYCSNFDLNAVDWMASYCNLKQFTDNLRDNLGKFNFTLTPSV